MSSDAAERMRLLAEGEGAYREYLTAEILHGHAAAGAVGLNATDFFTLNVLELAGPLTAGQLAKRTGLTTGAATRMIDRLEEGRFVRRVRDRKDRRKVIVEAVGDRRADIDAALEPARLRLFEVFQQFSASEIPVLMKYFAAAAPALQAAAANLRDRQTAPGRNPPQAPDLR